jgi:hypothetical protein
MFVIFKKNSNENFGILTMVTMWVLLAYPTPNTWGLLLAPTRTLGLIDHAYLALGP